MYSMFVKLLDLCSCVCTRVPFCGDLGLMLAIFLCRFPPRFLRQFLTNPRGHLESPPSLPSLAVYVALEIELGSSLY